jgi:hypothetical protein
MRSTNRSTKPRSSRGTGSDPLSSYERSNHENQTRPQENGRYEKAEVGARTPRVDAIPQPVKRS